MSRPGARARGEAAARDFRFDRDTRVEPIAPGRFRAEVNDGWMIGPVPKGGDVTAIAPVPNGGYVMAIGTAALAEVLPHPDPLTVTAHFLRPAEPGPVVIETEVAKVGRGHSTGAARLVQAGRERLRLLATFGDLGRARGPERVLAEPPPLPPLEACAVRRGHAAAMSIAERFEQRFDPATVRWMEGKPSGRMVLRAWQRFSDGREPDPLALVLFADALPPAVFDALEPGWVPTLELTVHVRARPAPGWLRSEFRTRVVAGGYLEEDGEIWDASGRLVALSRQLAAVPREPLPGLG